MNDEVEPAAARPTPERSKKKSRNRAGTRRKPVSSPRARPAKLWERQWTTTHLALSLALGLIVGAALGFERGRTSGGETAADADQVGASEAVGPVADPTEPAAPSTDKFGRSPGDEHFGHDHATEQPGQPSAPGPTEAPAPGEKDSFGRSPGEEHYGHQHP